MIAKMLFFKKSFLLIFLLLFFSNAFAIKEKVQTVVTGDGIKGGLTLQDGKYPNVDKVNEWQVKGSKALIKLGYDFYKTNNLASKSSLILTFDVNYATLDANKAIVNKTLKDISLTINNDVNPIDQAYIEVVNAYTVKVENVRVKDGNGAVVTSIPKDIYLKIELETERYYYFDETVNPSTDNTNLVSSKYNTVTDELEIFWDAIPGAEEYELEYTYLDDYTSVTFSNRQSLSSLSYDFRFNATRVGTSFKFYNIPLVYDRGYLAFRIRGVGKTVSSDGQSIFIKPGQWTTGEIGYMSALNETSQYFDLSKSNLENSLNYQVSSSFAEEGKRKDVVSYFDGSLRSRQTVTKTNTHNEVVIGQTIYDTEGRGALQILPSPVKKQETPGALKFYYNFNLNNGKPYTRLSFDNSGCEPLALPMDNTSGASNYYSLLNPFKDDENAYIPNAEGYPFTQVEFEPDNTGRIRRQGGVGKDYQLNSGHETKYFYGQPEQEQLDRLFGSSVGYNSHYKKNFVVDPNGQISVTYLDPAGKVIATALAGDNPNNVDGLDNAPAEASFKVTRIQETCPTNNPNCNKENKKTEKGLEFSSELLVTSDGNYKFSYNLKAEKYSVPSTDCKDATGADKSGICYDCVYDLEISITDKCGALVKGPNNENVIEPIRKTIGKVTQNADGSLSIDNTCSADILSFNLDPDPLEVYLAKGNYTITKKLLVNEEALKRNLDDYLNTSCPGKSLEELITEERNKSGDLLSSCQEVTCKSCLAALHYSGDLENGWAAYQAASDIPAETKLTTKAEYEEELNQCQELCKPISRCESSYQMMLSDMSPNGQYASTDESSVDWSLSIFNSLNSLPYRTDQGYRETWATPHSPVNLNKPAGYYDEEGNESYIEVRVVVEDDGTETIEPAVKVGKEGLERAVRNEDGSYTILEKTNENPEAVWVVKPQTLANSQDFISNWQSSWAASLVKFHPEFCYYEWCVKNSNSVNGFNYTSEDFDSRLLQIESYQDAKINITDQSHPFYDPRFAKPLLNSYNMSNANEASHAFYMKEILDQDPYFNGGAGTAQYDNMLAKLKAYSVKDGNWISLRQFAAISNRCASVYYGNLNDPILANYHCQDFGYSSTNQTEEEIDILDGEWNTYKSIYLSEKQKLQQDASDQFCLDKNQAKFGGYNGCIGNNNFNPFAPPFSYYSNRRFWGFRQSEQPCSWTTHHLYRTKKRRFIRVDDFEKLLNLCSEDVIGSMEEMKKKVNLEHYMETGQCPLNRDFQFLLDQLAQQEVFENKLSQSLIKYPAFSKELYDYVSFGKKKGSLSNYINYTLNFTGASTESIREFSISPASTSVPNTGTSITILSGQPYNYSYEDLTSGIEYNYLINDINFKSEHFLVEGQTREGVKGASKDFITKIVGIRNVAFIEKDLITKTSTFVFEATVEIYEKVGSELLLVATTHDIKGTGKTFFPIGECDFSTVCEVTGETYDLEALLTGIAAQGDLGKVEKIALDGTNENHYKGLFTSKLKSYTQGGSNSSGYSFASSTASFPLDINIENSANVVEYSIRLSLDNSTYSGLLSDIVSFSCIKAYDATSEDGKDEDNTDFLITGYYLDDKNNLQRLSFKGKVIRARSPKLFNVSKCGPPLPVSCKTIAVENTNNLQNFFSILVGSGSGKTKSNMMFYAEGIMGEISSNAAFINGLRDQMDRGGEGEDTYVWSNTKISTNELEAKICNYTNWGCKNSCDIKLSFVDKPEGISFTNIVDFADLKADYNAYQGGKTYAFTVKAVYYLNGSYQATLMQGSSCFPVENCNLSCFLGRENQVRNGDFADPTLNKDDNKLGVGFKTDFNLTIGNLQAEDYAAIVKDAKDVRTDGAWSGRDHTTGKDYFLIINPQENKRAWYTSVKVQKGEPYRFTAYVKNVCIKCGEKPAFALYHTDFKDSKNYIAHTGPIPYLTDIQDADANNYPPSSTTKNQRMEVEESPMVVISDPKNNISTTSEPSVPGGWVKVEGVFIPNQDYENLEIGITALNPLLSGHDFGIDDISFYKLCKQSGTLFPDPIEEEVDPCAEHLENVIRHNAELAFEKQNEERKNKFKKEYTNKCLSAAEKLSYTYDEREFHYTLYYYDQAGNLVKTIPPAGAKPLKQTDEDYAAKITLYANDRAEKKFTIGSQPLHTLQTTYIYNSLNQLIEQSSPDGGISKFWYDKLGRLVASQNAKQKNKGSYSYTQYDELGRITEVGEFTPSQGIEPTVTPAGTVEETAYNNWLYSAPHKQITKTFYDNPTITSVPGFQQANLRKRVSGTFYFETEPYAPPYYNHATHYTYDLHGNVKTIIKDDPYLNEIGQQFKRIDYEYDLVSGNVKLVKYQEDNEDQFYHKYEYDADNRITKVYTSKEGLVWDNDARYNYYRHGPLARTELGELKVQGIDYAYTLQGWVKGVNSNTLYTNRDIGKDGDATTTNKNSNVGQDAFGYSLGYNKSDYQAIGGLSLANNFLASSTPNEKLSGTSTSPADAPPLFNGNISSMVTTIKNIDPSSTDYNKAMPLLTAYRYDQLNRIKQMKAYADIVMAENKWGNGTSYDGSFESTFKYDPNGNITNLVRRAKGGTLLDDLQYKYDWVDGDVKKGLQSNKLLSIADNAPVGSTTHDIKTQSAGNYEYDAIGNLTKDASEFIKEITWTVYGKIKEIKRDEAGLINAGKSLPDLEFAYDESGNRILKIVKPRTPALSPQTDWIYTYYVRDAQGNIMATYEKKKSETKSNIYEFKLKEYSIYGSSRLGVKNVGRIIAEQAFDNSQSTPSPDNLGYKGYAHVLGQKYYELTNHLGNVLTVVSDKKVSNIGNNGSSYSADIVSVSDYYPFGMEMKERGSPIVGLGYRYGFNGMEMDNEVKGTENSYDFGSRIYDPRIGKFLSIDRFSSSFPGNSPYLFALNSPNVMIDENGDFAVYIHYRLTRRALVKLGVDYKIAREIARYSSVYADYPEKGMQFLNSMMAHLYMDFDGMDDMAMSSREEDKWKMLKNSQSPERISYGVAIHSMRAFWEGITEGEGVDRSLWGGDFKEKGSNQTSHWIGAFEILNQLMATGKSIEEYTTEEKMKLGLALHIIQDSQIHQGGYWNPDKQGENKNKNQHPDIGCTIGVNSDIAKLDTDAILSDIQENASRYKRYIEGLKRTPQNSIPRNDKKNFAHKKYTKENTNTPSH